MPNAATHRFLCIAVLCCLASGCGSCSKQTPLPPPPLPEMVPAETLKETDVLPHTTGPITPGRNYVYCGTFQLAWNEMREKIIGEPIALQDSPPMADHLNDGAFTRSDLDPDSYLAMVGKVEDGIVDDIRTAMREKFPTATFEPTEPTTDLPTIYAYAYLQKSLAFMDAFDRLPLGFHFGEKTVPVKGFGQYGFNGGTEHGEQLMKQVTILDYKSDDDFILSLISTSGQDQIVLAKVEPQATLGETIDAVKQRINESELEPSMKKVQEFEKLIVPIITCGVERKYSELIDKIILNPGWEDWIVTEARQGIKFRLDEYGARLESGAGMEAASGMPEEKPREFFFDKPFLIYLKQTGSAAPYFAMWIETPELLEMGGR